jgi:hypothetical protein
MRRPAVLIGAMLLLLASRTLAVPANNVLVSGQTKMAIIDGNDNGPDDDDCSFTGVSDAMGNVTVSTTQDENVPLRVCSGQYWGSIDPTFPTDSSILGKFTSSSITGGIGYPNVPFSFDGTFLPNGGGAGGGAAADGARTVTKVELTNGMGQVVGSGSICDSVARVTLDNGMTMAVGLLMDTPGFLRVQNLPFEKDDLSGFVFKDVYIPKTDGVVTFSLENAPNTILVQILLAGTCGRGAPTLSEWNLGFLALALLAGGAWMLGRRRSFYQTLPLP